VEEAVCVRALGADAQIVGAVVVDGIDLAGADELVEVDAMRASA
jgi:hypothetical protein